MHLLKDVYHGVYINLSRSKDRLKYISSHLKYLQIEHLFKRFEAIDGNTYDLSAIEGVNTDNEKACFISHHKIMAENAENYKHLHIIEDDVLMHKETLPILNYLFLKDNDVFNKVDFDILFLGNGMWNISDTFYNANIFENSGCQLLDLYEIDNYSGCYSYIINKKSISKIVDLIDIRINQYQYNYPIDMLLKTLIQTKDIKAFCLMPMIAIPSSKFPSDIDMDNFQRNKSNNPSEMSSMHEHFKYFHRLFYKGESLQIVFNNIVLCLKNKDIEIKNIPNNSTIQDLIFLLVKSNLGAERGKHKITVYPYSSKIE